VSSRDAARERMHRAARSGVEAAGESLGVVLQLIDSGELDATAEERDCIGRAMRQLMAVKSERRWLE
jgi:hypothetical protein